MVCFKQIQANFAGKEGSGPRAPPPRPGRRGEPAPAGGRRAVLPAGRGQDAAPCRAPCRAGRAAPPRQKEVVLAQVPASARAGLPARCEFAHALIITDE